MDKDPLIGFTIMGGLVWYLLPKPWAERKMERSA